MDKLDLAMWITIGVAVVANSVAAVGHLMMKLGLIK